MTSAVIQKAAFGVCLAASFSLSQLNTVDLKITSSTMLAIIVPEPSERAEPCSIVHSGKYSYIAYKGIPQAVKKPISLKEILQNLRFFSVILLHLH